MITCIRLGILTDLIKFQTWSCLISTTASGQIFIFLFMGNDLFVITNVTAGELVKLFHVLLYSRSVYYWPHVQVQLRCIRFQTLTERHPSHSLNRWTRSSTIPQFECISPVFTLGIPIHVRVNPLRSLKGYMNE